MVKREGMGNLMKDNWSENIYDYKYVSFRLLGMNFKCDWFKITVKVVYALCHDKDTFYKELKRAVEEVDPQKTTVIGDMDGGVKKKEKGAIHKYGIPGKNNNGKRIHGIYAPANMSTTSMYFQHKK